MSRGQVRTMMVVSGLTMMGCALSFLATFGSPNPVFGGSWQTPLRVAAVVIFTGSLILLVVAVRASRGHTFD